MEPLIRPMTRSSTMIQHRFPSTSYQPYPSMTLFKILYLNPLHLTKMDHLGPRTQSPHFKSKSQHQNVLNSPKIIRIPPTLILIFYTN